jgi:hypothetical protein
MGRQDGFAGKGQRGGIYKFHTLNFDLERGKGSIEAVVAYIAVKLPDYVKVADDFYNDCRQPMQIIYSPGDYIDFKHFEGVIWAPVEFKHHPNGLVEYDKNNRYLLGEGRTDTDGENDTFRLGWGSGNKIKLPDYASPYDFVINYG